MRRLFEWAEAALRRDALGGNAALDPGDNMIEVVAYNANNLLSSLPAHTTIKFTGSASLTLRNRCSTCWAIGINDYHDPGYRDPHSNQVILAPPLKLAVNDAKAFGAAIAAAGESYYQAVDVTYALNKDATSAPLDQLVTEVAHRVAPRDTFILYAAAHGRSQNGRFFLIPQDFRNGSNALAERAIGQEQLQDWIANRIKAKKVLILVDTCESGALVGGYTRSRVDQPSSEASIGRLHEATGRPVLTAAAGGKDALEGYQGHGVFTYALIDALNKRRCE